MRSDTFSLFQTVLQKGFPVIFSFLDDALLLGLTKIGISVPWLQWLSLILLSATILYWTFRIARFLYQRYS
ncbi:MAG: hypothetical protein AAGE59_34195 [Cyanobacteria bacterium P01_F01_bin.86]